MRKPFIAGNWKMFKDNKESVLFIEEIVPLLEKCEEINLLVSPNSLALSDVIKAAKGSNVMVAAQNCSWEDEGAFTGEMSPRSLSAIGCTHVMLGHSERRHIFGESSEDINKKLIAALKNDLLPIVCIGELLSQRESGDTFSVIEEQIIGALKGLNQSDVKKLIMAYEPVWAIGTGKTATPAQAQEVHSFIRKKIDTLYGSEVSNDMIILYGGSVKPDNIEDLLSKKDIDGALIGGASLKQDSFTAIAKTANGCVF